MQTTRVLDETVIFFHEGRRLTGGRYPSSWTLRRWSLRGLRRQKTGELVTLEWCFMGTARVTSQEAYRRFIEKINGEMEEREP